MEKVTRLFIFSMLEVFFSCLLGPLPNLQADVWYVDCSIESSGGGASWDKVVWVV
jgi:hypothetical protein